MQTKEKILQAALDQFNRDGVEVVTTRHIAAELGMSQGNLHYHFPNKNALLEQLFETFVERLQRAQRFNGEDALTKALMLASMEDNFMLMWDYRFLFRDKEVIARRFPELSGRINGLLQQQNERIHQLVSAFHEAGNLRKSIGEEQRLFLGNQVSFFIASWISGVDFLEGNEPGSHRAAVFAFRLWLPYLREELMHEWEQFLADDGNSRI